MARTNEYTKSFFANFKMKTDTANMRRQPRHRTNEYARTSVTNFSMKTREHIYAQHEETN